MLPARPGAGRQSVWRNRDYMILWGGQAVSVTGSRISEITLPLLLLALTGSAAQTGLVIALYGVPYPLIGPIAGVAVDRWDRRRVMIACEMVNIVVTASIPLALWTHHLSLVQVGVVALLSGAAFTLFNVAEVSALPSVVSAEQLPEAVAQNHATFNLGGILGPLASGSLYQIARALPFLADTVSYAASLLSLLLLRKRFGPGGAGARERIWPQVVEGIGWMWRHPTIRSLTLLTGAYNLLVGGFTLLIIQLARDRHASPALIGLAFGLASIGAVAGSALAPRIVRRLGVGGVAIGFFWFSALLYPLLIVAPNAVAIGAVNAVAFLAGPSYNVAVVTYRLAVIPDGLQGRVNGMVRSVVLGASPIGAAATGFLLQSIGAAATVWAIAGGTAMLAVIATGAGSVRRARIPASA